MRPIASMTEAELREEERRLTQAVDNLTATTEQAKRLLVIREELKVFRKAKRYFDFEPSYNPRRG